MSALICTGGLGEFPFFEIDVICTDEGCCREEEEEQEMGASTKKKSETEKDRGCLIWCK